MCNEELAILIKQGRTELYGELWDNIKALLYKFSNRFYYDNAERCTSAGVELEDIKQSCFFVLADMVKAYNPEKGFKFNTYARYHFANRMKALMNGETEGARSAAYINLLNTCASLDEPIKGIKSDSEEISLMDTVEDEAAFEVFERIHHNSELAVLHIALENAIKRLPTIQRDVIRKKYLKCKHGEKLSKEEQKTAKKAMAVLRKDSELRTFGIEYLGLNFYSGTGVTAWKSSQVSSVERLVEKAERIRKYAQNRPDEGE